MKRRDFLKIAGTGLLGTAIGCANARQQTTSRPNILLIMADDMGYSDIGCFGGEIDTPNLNSLAADGLRFTQFYNCARCCPTRASLMTGLFPHQAGVGGMVNKGPTPAYLGHLNDRCVTIAEALKSAGYRTYMSGKAHWGEQEFAWPINRGFDHHYGLVSGAMNYFDITKGKADNVDRIFVNDHERLTPKGGGFYTTNAFTDHAIAYLDEHSSQYASQPFFMYMAYNAPHWPLHALPEDIAKYRGKYRDGWEKLRKNRHARQTQMNLFGKPLKLSPLDENTAGWDQLTDSQKDEMDLKMAVYAAQVHCMDRNIGRILTRLKEIGQFDNTLIMFLSDNGACAESGPLGSDWRNGKGGPIGTVDSFTSYGLSWANAGNTPFVKFKSWTHEGGCATPFIAHWPGQIAQPGTTTSEIGHVIDIMATCCEVAGISYPTNFNDKPVIATPGISLIPALKRQRRDQHPYLVWEHIGKRALRKEDWKIVYANAKSGWQLYDLKNDRTELHNLADSLPDKLNELKTIWYAWADTWQVDYKDKT